MARRKKAELPAAIDTRPWIIDSGYVSRFIVHRGREFDPVAKFEQIEEAVKAYPQARVSEAARRRAERGKG